MSVSTCQGCWPGVLCLVLGVGLGSGCVGSLEDPERFTGACAAGVDVEADILYASCAGEICHSPGPDLAAGLDLVSSGVTDRVVGVTSESEDCGGRVLVTAGDPEASLLFAKVKGEPPCGDRMPLAQDPLDPDELACVRDWIAMLAEGP